MPPRTRPGSGRQQRPAAAAPAPAPEGDQASDDVVFSATEWLASKGLIGARAVEVGGRTFRVRPTLDLPETAQLVIAIRTQANSDALRLLLEDREDLAEMLRLLQVPVDTDAEQEFWNDFLRAVAGVDLGESPAS